ncbi:hypothetical protein ACFY9N_14800 [Microbacterium sp. NPDC008134]
MNDEKGQGVDETEFWLSQPGIREDVDDARLLFVARTLHSAEETLSRYSQ